MRFCLLLFIIAYSYNGISQEIKKKYLGVYTGEIPSYALELGEEVFKVESALIEIQLKPEGVVLEKITGKEITGK